MASRSTLVILQNQTQNDLQLTHAELSGGVWTSDMYPPTDTGPRSGAKWQSESNGFMTGTEGSVTFYLQGAGNVTIGWDNPFSGSNSYQASCPKGFTLTSAGGDGNNATITYTLAPSAQ
ncbi:MAG TPA: aegerolysin family protein [Longimicrobiaceae bacterium]|nr:aegerolysin family protein [Longimicrobiaceae bacterium]